MLKATKASVMCIILLCIASSLLVVPVSARRSYRTIPYFSFRDYSYPSFMSSFFTSFTEAPISVISKPEEQIPVTTEPEEPISVTPETEEQSSVTSMQYGVCSWPWTLTERDFQEAKALGITQLRMDFPWGAFEQYRGATFVYSEYDRFVTWGRNYDIEIIPILCNVPTWFNTGSEWKIPTGAAFNDFATRFGQYVYNVVDHYKADIQYFEIWNEPNIKNFWNDPDATYIDSFWVRGAGVQKYTTLLQTAYTQAKLANPNSIIISGGLSGNDDRYLESMYDYGAKGYFDILGLHPYFSPNTPTQNYDPDYVQWNVWAPHQFPKISLMRDVMVNHGDENINIIITELGVGTEFGAGPEGPVTEEIQARALTRIYEKLSEEFPYVIGCMWFHLRTDMENYGLFQANYTPRQMYYAYKEIINVS